MAANSRGGNPAKPGPGSESYFKVVANLATMLIALLAIGILIARDARMGKSPVTPEAIGPETSVVAAPRPRPRPKPAPAPIATPEPEETTPEVVIAPPPPPIDQAVVHRAEESLDSASRDRARAEARAEDAAKRLAEASRRAAAESRGAKTLASRVRDPSTRISQASARGGVLRAERDKLKGEVATLAATPRPNAKILSNKNPVARPSDGDEFHFEVRRNRVSYIDLERLLTMVKSDAMLRVRLSEGARVVDSRVGPVGAFSLEYSMMRSLPSALEDMVERRRVSFDLRGWEIVPEFEGRGEGYEATLKPISDYARAINRLNPRKATITFWVYPDSFGLFRKLREDLQNRGFLVAARPLPEGMAIRGSPAGSLSAGQ